jgi:hypothetical protein
VGLTMAERKAVTKQVAKRHRRASKAEKGRILDELCALTGWSRRHARRALGQAAEETPERARAARPRTYGRDVLEPLRRIWATLDAPAGKRLAPFMSDIVEAMERWGELEVTPELRAKLLRVSAATIDRLLAPERRRLRVRGRSGTKPGSLLKRQIPSGPSPSGTSGSPGSARWTWSPTTEATPAGSSARPWTSPAWPRDGPRCGPCRTRPSDGASRRCRRS